MAAFGVDSSTSSQPTTAPNSTCSDQTFLYSCVEGVLDFLTGATAGLRRSGDEPFKTKWKLSDAAQAWCAGGSERTAVVAKYGKIENWNVSEITDMSKCHEAALADCDLGLWLHDSWSLCMDRLHL